jgi:hypothetical protein
LLKSRTEEQKNIKKISDKKLTSDKEKSAVAEKKSEITNQTKSQSLPKITAPQQEIEISENFLEKDNNSAESEIEDLSDQKPLSEVGDFSEKPLMDLENKDESETKSSPESSNNEEGEANTVSDSLDEVTENKFVNDFPEEVMPEMILAPVKNVAEKTKAIKTKVAKVKKNQESKKSKKSKESKKYGKTKKVKKR